MSIRMHLMLCRHIKMFGSMGIWGFFMDDLFVVVNYETEAGACFLKVTSVVAFSPENKQYYIEAITRNIRLLDFNTSTLWCKKIRLPRKNAEIWIDPHFSFKNSYFYKCI